jgi:hypothetical protein
MSYRIRCAYPETCRCTHTECDAGWLDQEVTHVKHGVTYTAAVRCPVCALAIPAARPTRTRRSRLDNPARVDGTAW